MAQTNRKFWPRGSWTKLGAMYLVVFIAVAFAPVALAQASEHCPGESATGAPPLPAGMEIIHEGGESGSFTQDGVTISWSGTTITISGGSVTFCVKAGTAGSTGIITRGPGTYTTAELGLTGPQGQGQGVSHLVVYATTTTTTTTPPPTTTTPPPTTTTPPPTTTTPPPTTTPPTVLPTGTTTTTGPTVGGVSGTTPAGGGTAFTGPEDAPWLIAAMIAFLLAGSLALRLGSRPQASRESDWTD